MAWTISAVRRIWPKSQPQPEPDPDLTGGGQVGYRFHVPKDPLEAIPAAYACVSLLSSTIAKLPVMAARAQPGVEDYYEPLPDHPASVLLANPSDNLDRYQFYELLLTRLFSGGNAYAWVRRQGPLAVELIPATLHKPPEWVRDGATRTVRYELQLLGVEPDPTGHRPTVTALDRDVVSLHTAGFDGLTSPSPIQYAARRTLSTMSLAVDSQTKSFVGAGVRNAIQSDPALAELTPDQLDDLEARLRKSMEKARGSGEWPILSPGYSVAAGSGFSPADLQTVELLRWGVEDVCRVWLIPPRSVGHYHEGFRATRFEAQQADLERYAIEQHVHRIQEQLEVKVVSDAERAQGVVVRVPTDRVRRGSWSEESAATGKAVANDGLLTPNEGRRRLGYPPVDGGDELLSPKGAPPQNPGGGADPEPQEYDDGDGEAEGGDGQAGGGP